MSIDKNPSSTHSYTSAFFIVPARIMELPGLTLAYARIYETIFQFWNHNRPCYLSNNMIMERARVNSISTIIDAFKYFESHNELKRVQKNGKRYLVQPERQIEEPVDNSDDDSTKNSQPIAKSIGGYRQSDRGGIDAAIHNNKNINIKNINKSICANEFAQAREESSNSKAKASPKTDASFEEFWQHYPVKKNKTRAQQIWQRKKLEEKAPFLLEDIQNRVKNDHSWREKKFIPHPSRYLAEELWEDDVITGDEKGKMSSKKSGFVQNSYTNTINEPRCTVPWFEDGHPSYDEMKKHTRLNVSNFT